jgi:hypothetical protein
MDLRERQWKQLMHIDAHRGLPHVHGDYAHTATWLDLKTVLNVDLKRMPKMHARNVTRIVQRHSATTPWHPYTQGHLYIIYTMAHVLRDERSLYWGYAHACRLVHRYGPDTTFDDTVLPDKLYGIVCRKLNVCRNLFDTVLRMRWLYVLFGQAIPSPASLCCVWDYVLKNDDNMYRMCASLLEYAMDNEHDVHPDKCHLERFSDYVSIQIHSDVAVAALIADAQSKNTLACTRLSTSTLTSRRRAATGQTKLPTVAPGRRQKVLTAS